MDDCIIIGAGIAGLIAGRDLKEKGWSVRILEKSRGVGGRMAYRRADGAIIDHGAQFLTLDDEGFRTLALSSNRLQPWFDHWPDSQSQRMRYRGEPSMSAFPKWLAEDLQLERQARVTAASFDDRAKQWSVQMQDREPLQSRHLLITAPVPQALELLKAGHVSLPDEEAAWLESAQYDRCLTVMALLQGPSGLNPPGIFRLGERSVKLLADNMLKGISSVPALTLHSTPDFAQQHWDDQREKWGRALLDQVEDLLGSPVASFQTHRWRFSDVREPLGEDCYINNAMNLAMCGDAFLGSKVEKAALSGRAVAARLAAEG